MRFLRPGLPKPPDDLKSGIGLAGAGRHDQQDSFVALGDGFDGGVDGVDLVVARGFIAAIVEIVLEDDGFGLGRQPLPGAIARPQVAGRREGVKTEGRFPLGACSRPCTKFITPALRQAGWDEMAQIREEVSFTKGRIIVRGKLVSRGKGKRADYILYYKPNIPIALIEAKDNTHATGDGMQQGLDYAETLKIPFVFSSNGDGFVFHDCVRTDS